MNCCCCCCRLGTTGISEIRSRSYFFLLSSSHISRHLPLTRGASSFPVHFCLICVQLAGCGRRHVAAWGYYGRNPRLGARLVPPAEEAFFFLSRDSHDPLPQSFIQCSLHSINRTPFLNPRHEVVACPYSPQLCPFIDQSFLQPCANLTDQ